MYQNMLRCLLIFAALLPATASALGLGPIVQHSHLNQRLEARVPIIAASQEELDSLKITLAEPEAFNQAGITVPLRAQSLRFALITESAQPYVRITSRQAIREPSLSLLIDFIWSRGHRRQQYTLLLDPAR